MKIISSFILLLLLLLLLLLHYNTASASSIKNRINHTLLMNSDNNGQVDTEDDVNVDEFIGNGTQNLAEHTNRSNDANEFKNIQEQSESSARSRDTDNDLKQNASTDPALLITEMPTVQCLEKDNTNGSCYVKPEIKLHQCNIYNSNPFTSVKGCSVAIDGNTDDRNFDGSCIRRGSSFSYDCWDWFAHFNGVAAVHYVTVYSSIVPYNANQTIRFFIYIDDKPCAGYEGGPFTAKTLRCNATGSSIRIHMAYSHLTMCEVKVFGDMTSAHQLKLSRCWQTGDSDEGHSCDKAIDGDVESFAEVGRVRGNWTWLAFTERNATISNVIVYFGREYIFELLIYIDGRQCAHDRYHNWLREFAWLTDCKPVGSKVEIQILGEKDHKLFEIVVIGNYIN